MSRNEDEARALGQDKERLKRRLLDARLILEKEYRREFGKGRFNFDKKRLISDDGNMILQWQLRINPDEPESYENQQTNRGTVIALIA